MLARNFTKTSTKKVVSRKFAQIVSAQDAVSNIQPGNTVLAGGFGICGNPQTLIKQIAANKIGGLTVVSNNAGLDTYGLGLLLNERLVDKMISSYVGENAEFERQYMNGELELEITPQGTLAEKIRSGGKGIPAFWTPTGANTLIETGGFPVKFAPGGKVEEKHSQPKESRMFNGKFPYF